MKKSKTPVVAITGASGFLGSVLVDHFIKKGWNVVSLVRNNKKTSKSNIEFRAYDITKPVSPELLKNVDYLVHAAYIKLNTRYPDAKELNITGAKNIIKAATSAGVKHMTFVSTMSAHKDAISVYGKQKLEIENLFLKEKNSTVLRSGLIVGNGGIVQEMAKFMKSKHAVPLVGGGTQPLQIISVYDLAIVIERVYATKGLEGRFVVATPRVYSYKEFYQALAKQLDIKVLFVPVPYWLLEAVFKTASALNISLGVGDDNLKGLKKLISMPSAKDLHKINISLMELDEALAKASLETLGK